MTEQELIQKATKLIRRYDNMRIIGARGEWSGSARQGFMFNPQRGGGSAGGVTPPGETGACCFDDGTCTIETSTQCALNGGTYQGDGTVCFPNPCPQPPFECGSLLFLGCVGVMCDTNPSGGSYTSVFDLDPGFMAPAANLSGSTGPSDHATLDWNVDIILDGMGGYSASYTGTVTGRYGSTQAFGPYILNGTCGILNSQTHTDRFCGSGSGNCSDILGCVNANCILAFDSGMGFGVTIQFL